MVTGASAGDDMPAGVTFELRIESPGTAELSLVSPVDLPADVNSLVALQVEVLQSAAVGTHGVFDVHSIIAEDDNGTQLPAVDDDALHLVAIPGDLSGDGRVTANDASLVARIAALVDSFFAATPLVDPAFVGDTTGNGRLNAADATAVARRVAGLGFATAFRSPTSSTSLKSSDQVERKAADSQDPILFHDADRREWHRAAIDRLMASGVDLISTMRREEHATSSPEEVDVVLPLTI